MKAKILKNKSIHDLNNIQLYTLIFMLFISMPDLFTSILFSILSPHSENL